MACLQDIRRRIRSVKNTQQVTKAMKMISAVKLRKSKERLVAFQPYSNKMTELVQNLVYCCRCDAQLPEHPVVQACIAPREEKNIRLVVVASDKGLCGGFNANVLKLATVFVGDCESNIVHLDVLGKRAVEWANKHGYKIDKDYIGVSLPNIANIAEKIVNQAILQYELGAIDAFYVAYNCFGSALTQIPVIKRIFPVDVRSTKEDKMINNSYLLEPNPALVLSTLLSRFVETAFLRVLLESFASEHGARMAAMDKASINAEDMIARLTLNMNKVRQAAITNQIIEIVSGANA